MSYLNVGSAQLGSTLQGATTGGAPLYVDSSLKLREDFAQFVYSDFAGDPTATFGLGVGPVGPAAGYTPPNIGGYKNLSAVFHVEDPGPGYYASRATLAYPTALFQSHYHGPAVVLNAGAATRFGYLAVNSTASEFGPAGRSAAGDLWIDTASGQGNWIRIGSSKVVTGAGSIEATMSVGGGGGASAGTPRVGVLSNNPQATLHAGCGTDIPALTGAQVYASAFGDTAIVARDSTHHIEMGIGVVTSQPFVGTGTATDMRFALNRTMRGIWTQTGNLFVGSVTPGSYNPESNVLGLTGFPSGAISIAGNRSVDGSIGQFAVYNDAAGLGTQVSAFKVSRAGANNTVTLDLQTAVAGALVSRIFVDGAGNVGINTNTPQAGFDINNTDTSVVLPRLSGDPTGVNGGAYYNTVDGIFRGYQGGVWATFLTKQGGQGGVAGGINSQVQFNSGGSLQGSTNFEWDNTNNVLLIGQPPVSAYYLDVRGTSDGLCCYNNFVAGFGTVTFDENRVDLFSSAGTASWRIVGMGPFAPNGLTFGDVQFSRAATGRALSVPSDNTNYPIAYMTGMSFGVMTNTPLATLDVMGSSGVTPLPNPTMAITAVLAGVGAGNVPNGTHDYLYVFLYGSTNTWPGLRSNNSNDPQTTNRVVVADSTTNGKVQLTIPTGPPQCTARRIFRSAADHPTSAFYLLTTIPDNTTTTYLDNKFDYTFQGQPALDVNAPVTSGNNTANWAVSGSPMIVTENSNVCIGSLTGACQSGAGGNVFIGDNCSPYNTNGFDNVCIGRGIDVLGWTPTFQGSSGCVAIGESASTGGLYSVSVGGGANARAYGCIAIGTNADCNSGVSANANHNIAIGFQTQCAPDLDYGGAAQGTMAIGANVVNKHSHALMIGGPKSGGFGDSGIYQAWFGQGEYASTPIGISMWTTSALPGTINTPGGSFCIVGGMGTGSARSGDIVLFTATGGASNSTINPLTETMRVQARNVGVGTSTPGATFHSTGTTIVGGMTNTNLASKLGVGQIGFWINESGNALTFQVKYANGTTKTGTVTLA